MKFSDFNFQPKVASGIQASGFDEPTAIQTQAIPHILEGKDVLGLAQTGTGKTAAFALPILNQLLPHSSKQPRALIVAPTRELADQIHEAFSHLGQKTGLRSLAIYGGVNITGQIRRLQQGSDIVVACPGRLLDHIRQQTIQLQKIGFLVLDEADRMFDMGFLPDIRRIVKTLPVKRQNLLFSATMPNDIRRLAQEILLDPVTVQIDMVRPASTISSALYPIAQHLKTPLLIALLKNTKSNSVLIFTRTKHRAKKLGQALTQNGFKASSLQGNLSQNRRKEALDGFRSGKHQILVATDIASRGIDVSSISHVINFDMPDTTDAFIHRIGRTGRAERSGDAFTFVTQEDESLVRNIERILGERIKRQQLPGFNYNQATRSRA